jgi:hypothetical protein
MGTSFNFCAVAEYLTVSSRYYYLLCVLCEHNGGGEGVLSVSVSLLSPELLN